MPPTSGTESGLWRTPHADEAVGRGEYKDVEKIKERWKKHQVLLCQQVKMWPTPCGSEARQGFQDRSRGMKGTQESLTTVVVKDQGMASGSLNPDWVCWLMGYPPGYLNLSESQESQPE